MSNKDTIKSLSERQQARDKVAIWFGSRDNFSHPLKEVVANSIDEIINNFDNGQVTISLNDECDTITVEDTGRGIPIDGQTDGIENYKLLLLKLFAGTNYDNNEHGKITTGTNGVGITVTNYCSKYFKVVSHRNNKVHTIEFEDGGNIINGLQTVDDSECKHGTSVTFKLDNDVFTNIQYNIEDIKELVKNLSGVAPQVEITVKYKDDKYVYKYDSFKEYFEETAENLTCKTATGYKKTYTLNDETNIIQCMIATSSSPIQKSFLNITYLSEGGTINRGIIYGTRDFINAHIKENKLTDKKLGELSHTDIEESVSFVCNLLSTNTEFSNQTKLSTNKSLYLKIAKNYINETLEVFKVEQPKEFEKFVNHILEVQKYNGKAQAAKKALKKKLSEKVDNLTNRVESLIDCKHHGEDSEIFIAEGKSALGSIIAARNSKNQAGIAIRGKILNCLKVDYDTIFKNDTVTDIIKSLGCGIETDKKNKDLGCFDKSSLRYGKIILSCDADPDGNQIVCLLLTMFYRLTPSLIKDGHLYIALTPLFEIKDLNTNEYYYAYSDDEKDEIISKIEKFQINRNKGLGEIDADVMAKTGVDPTTRNILKVEFDDVEEMIKMFDNWMGHDTTERKRYIEADLNKYYDNE